MNEFSQKTSVVENSVPIHKKHRLLRTERINALLEYWQNKRPFHLSTTDHARVTKGVAPFHNPEVLRYSALTIQPFALVRTICTATPGVRPTGSLALPLGHGHWNGVTRLKVSAKQISRRRPAFRPQTCWRRGQLFLQVGQYLIDHHRIVDAGDDTHRPAAFPAGLDVDIEHSLETFRPPHLCPSLGGGLLLAIVGGFGFVPPPPSGRCHQRTVFAVRGKDIVEACQVDARFGYQGGQPRNEIQRIKDDVRGAIAVRGLGFLSRAMRLLSAG